MKTKMTEYRKMLATLIAYELDAAVIAARLEIRRTKELGAASRRLDDLTREYQRSVTGERDS